MMIGEMEAAAQDQKKKVGRTETSRRRQTKTTDGAFPACRGARKTPATQTDTPKVVASIRPQVPRPHTIPVPPTSPDDSVSASESSQQPERPVLMRPEGLRILVQRANAGSASALKSLRQLLDTCPEIWREIGDLGRHAELAWIDLFAGGNHLVKESAKRHVAQMKNQLKGPTPSALESLMVDQICVTWLATKYSEVASAEPGTVSLSESAFRHKRAESTQKRYLNALKALAMVRALVPQGLVPLASPQMSPAPQAPQESKRPAKAKKAAASHQRRKHSELRGGVES